ncbi:uncharacterized protein LOC6048171 [Culex quinquefasciatus]|nr:uncharacterized protein LOC6048171 [Culex quinquefasciatus]
MSLKSDEVFAKIAKRLENIDPANRQVQQVYKFRITKDGKVVKNWVMDLKAVKLTESDGDAEATLIMDDEIMFAIGTGAMPAKEAMAQDKMEVEGQVELIFLLEPFIASLKSKMSLKSDLIWDKLNERLAQIDPTNRTFKVILLVHLQKDAATVKSVVLDFDSLKIVEIERGASGSGEYSAGRFEATLEIDDEDFFKVATKEVTFKELIEQDKAKVTGNKEAFITLDEKFRKK